MPEPRSDARLTTRRVMGIETEFGVLHADAAQRAEPAATSAIMLSHLAVGAYALLGDDPARRGRRVRWDYGDETPLRDARGFELTRAAAHPTQLTDQVRDAHVPMMDVPSVDADAPLPAREEAPEGDDSAILAWAVRRSVGNAVLSNGARLYVDHAHPEYSSPEVTSAREGLVYDRAGELIAVEAMRRLDAAERVPSVVLYKNNTDSKGASYGTHENYLLDRDIPFGGVVEALVPFFATRAVITGSGRVGIGTRGQQPGFQISSRADFFEAEVGLETTLNRPIVNSRDEPHADARRHRRLHVIIGDATLVETATYLKLGITSLVLAALEAEHRDGTAILPRISLADPVEAVHAVSHDPTLRVTVATTDGEQLTALQIQRRYAEAIAAHADRSDPETADVLAQWTELLDLLAEDPRRAADRVEWAAKLTLLDGYRQRHGLTWDDPRLMMIDLQFSDLRPERSLYARLRAGGSVRTLVADEEVARAVHEPPATTRAHLRGALIAAHPDAVTSAGWDVLTLAGATSGARLRLADPLLGSADWCTEHGIDPSSDPDTVLAALRRAVADPPSIHHPRHEEQS
ncbi:depupylase/deamidase Dop [Brachybacterium huguangmaarense]|uniref:Depupylase/deamidase Dop n=1 Tax=Brachybacterium huguangmaarense TaxID=1652028 RepID=A0ABY6G0D4_9MICO|nr:depupylase/deamidase Dop [Brachybacterium huguangmaarense]UYG16301.1 depupylase/deamidase Dop [Brachybacterium huguangmaarense]